MSSSKDWTFGAVGDVFVHRRDFEKAFTHSDRLLQSVDLLSGNCEGTFSDRPSPSPGAGWVVMSPRAYATAFGPAGFHVMSAANNHSLDGGYDGLDDTMAVLHEQGIKTVGAGRTLSQAREPAIIERQGVKVGFLSFSSVHPPGYAARPKMPGVAAIRIHSHYYMKEGDPYGYIEPGVAPHVMTLPWQEDLAMMADCVVDLKTKVDVVVASFHWGSSRYPARIMDYERTLGRAAVDAGCDIVLGHHHHFLRGIEMHRGKPIFYGLGHFVFDQKTDWTEEELVYLHSIGEFGIYPREGYPLLPFHPDGRLTMMITVRFDGSRIDKVGFVPCVISPENYAVPAVPGTPEHDKVLGYMREISQAIGLSTTYTPGAFKVGDFDVVSIS